MPKRTLLFILTFGMVVTIAANWLVWDAFQTSRERRSQYETDRAYASVKLVLDRASLAIRALQGLYNYSDRVDGPAFDRFVKNLLVENGLNAFGFVRIVPENERDVYEAIAGESFLNIPRIWEEGPDGAPVPAPRRNAYFVIERLHLFGKGKAPIGFDAASDPLRSTAIRRAIERRKVIVSDPTELISSEQRAVLLYFPVMKPDGAQVGVAFGSITLDNLSRIAAASSDIGSIRIDLDDPHQADVADEANEKSFMFGGKMWSLSVHNVTDPDQSAVLWTLILVSTAGIAGTFAALGYATAAVRAEEITRSRQYSIDMLNSLGPIVWMIDVHGEVLMANRSALDMTGDELSKLIGQSVLEQRGWRPTAESALRLRAGLADAARGGELRFDCSAVITDEEHVFDVWIRPIVDSKGRVENIVLSAVDVSARYEAEQTQRLLMRELDHRMKNTLQVIQAIIRRTSRAQNSVKAFEAALLGRVNTMSRAHELLAGERWVGANLGVLAAHEVETFDTEGAISLRGPTIRISPKASLSFALVLHELATNAAKYGALSVPKGRVSIVWSIETLAESDEKRLVFLWKEFNGPEVVEPESKGFGTLLIERSIAYDLDGEAALTYAPYGVICRISVPLRAIHSAFGETKHSAA